MSVNKLLSFGAVFLGVTTFVHGTVVLNIGSTTLSSSGGTPIAANTLLQLVNLGANGVFDSINVADGNATGLNRWVSGDDTVLDFTFRAIGTGGTFTGDFSSTSHFDLRFNNVSNTDTTAGFFSRTFEIDGFSGAFPDGLPSGIKLGVRWFPGLTINSDADFNAITLAVGQSYGQFTRQAPSPILNGGSYWVTPGDGGSLTFDPLITSSEGSAAGQATLTVVPEPAAIAFSLLGAAGLATLRRRRG